MSDTTGNINDKSLSKFDENGGIKTIELAWWYTKPTWNINDKTQNSLVNSSWEVKLNILSL